MFRYLLNACNYCENIGENIVPETGLKGRRKDNISRCEQLRRFLKLL